MIESKSNKEFESIVAQFGTTDGGVIPEEKCDEFLEYLKEENRLNKIIENYNNEVRSINNIEVLTEFHKLTGGFRFRLKNTKRLFTDKYGIDTLDILYPLDWESELTKKKLFKLKCFIKKIIKYF